MKKFVKILAIVMTLVILFSLTACKVKFKCESCGRTVKSKVHRVNIDDDSKKEKICDDCYSLYKLFGGD